MTTHHLWEYDHPFYADKGNYYKIDHHSHFDSWQEFTSTTFYDGDRDMNLLYRWDWISPRRHPDPLLRGPGEDYLLLFFILQRKAICCSAEIAVADADEPAVRAWLEECAAAMRATWDPLLPPHAEAVRDA